MYEISWAYDNDKLRKRAQNASKKDTNSKLKTKKKKKKKETYINLKQKELNWFILESSNNIIPSPIEDKIRQILNTLDIDFHYEVSFNGLNPTGHRQGFLRFDFYIPSKKIAIEYQGKDYHKDPKVKERDKLKRIFCNQNNIILKTYNKKDLPDIDRLLYQLVFSIKTT